MHKIEKRSVFLFCSLGLGLRGLAFAVLACFPPGWNGGFHLWRFPGESLGRGHAFFSRWVFPDSRALSAGLPGLPGSWSLELLPPSHSGCVRLPLPRLFITPFASLVYPLVPYPHTYIALYFSYAKVTCNTHKIKKLLSIPLKLVPSLAKLPLPYLPPSTGRSASSHPN